MTTHDRIEYLLTAAATDAITEAESHELELLAAARPEVRAELEGLRSTLARLDTWAAGAGSWMAPEPSDRLDRAVARLGREAGSQSGRRRSTSPRLVAAAVALVAAGSLGTLGLQALKAEQTVQGPPGTLGAVEPLSPAQGDSAVPGRVEASFIAHTWGTEAVLDVAGTRPGAVYDVYVLDRAGREVPAGAFLGSRVTVHCRMNAAVLREDVSGLRITDADGAVVASAQAPLV